ncbi:MAG: carboxypeptidase-like regulatory domain-containing protein [Pyrinomonadaceae bacterium]
MKILFLFTVWVSCSLSVVAQDQKLSRLTGTIYDQNGAVIVGAKINAKAGRTVVHAVTDNAGFYMLTLPFNHYQPKSKSARYDITVESQGFRKSLTKNYVFIPSYTGRMVLDIAMQVFVPRSKRKRATGLIL